VDLTSFVVKGVQFWFCWLLSLPQQLRDIIDIRFFRRHLRHSVLKESADLGKKVALVATWPRVPLRQSIQRLLDALQTEGWSVVLVANESPDTDQLLDQWSASADVVIRRVNIGRDFGAYQCGYRYLRDREQSTRIQRIALFNDSVLYPPGIEKALSELLTKDAPIAGFFLNYQFHTHMQSFALTLGTEVGNSSELDDFWKTYYPSNLRRYAIRGGEVELTRRVLKKWSRIDVVVTHERLVAADPDIWSGLSIAEQQNLKIWLDGGHRYDLDWMRREGNRSEYLDVMAREALTARNASHALGMVASRLLSVPLKLDLLQRGACTVKDFSETIDHLGLEATERTQILMMVMAGGTEASMGFVRKRMLEFGF
jgi:hypothetical protein